MKNKYRKIKCISGTDVDIKQSINIAPKVIEEAGELLDGYCFFYSNLFFSMTKGVQTRYVEGILMNHTHKRIITHAWNVYKGKLIDISLVANVMYTDNGKVDENLLKAIQTQFLYYPVHTYRNIKTLEKELQKRNYIFYHGDSQKFNDIHGLVISMADNFKYTYHIT